MRALQDFDPLNVCQVGHSEAAPAQKYTIHEHAHRGLKRRVGLRCTYAAHPDGGFHGVPDGNRVHAGCQHGEFLSIGNAHLLNHVGRERVDGNGHVLKVFTTFLRRNDHFLKNRGLHGSAEARDEEENGGETVLCCFHGSDTLKVVVFLRHPLKNPAAAGFNHVCLRVRSNLYLLGIACRERERIPLLLHS